MVTRKDRVREGTKEGKAAGRITTQLTQYNWKATFT